MADVPHQGPNLSRMPLEGVGGLIIASLPAFALLIATPLGFALWVAAGAFLAPFIYWRNQQAHGRENPGNRVVTLTFGVLLGALLMGVPSLRGALVPFGVTCLAAAALIHWRSQGERHPSIRA